MTWYGAISLLFVVIIIGFIWLGVTLDDTPNDEPDDTVNKLMGDDKDE